MQKATVFVSGILPGDAVPVLLESFEVVQYEAGVSSLAFSACAERVRGIVSLLTDRIDAALLERTPRLAVVSNVAVGVDNIDRRRWDLHARSRRLVAPVSLPPITPRPLQTIYAVR